MWYSWSSLTRCLSCMPAYTTASLIWLEASADHKQAKAAPERGASATKRTAGLSLRSPARTVARNTFLPPYCGELAKAQMQRVVLWAPAARRRARRHRAH
jgi:hypothetical protein